MTSVAAKPLVAVTLGDPAGIGSEVIVGAWAGALLHERCRAMAVGHPELLRRAARLLGRDVEVVEVSGPEETDSSLHQIPCLACGDDQVLELPPGEVTSVGGHAAYESVCVAAKLALAGRVDAIATAPLSKAALHKAGYPYPGHTELLAELCGADEVAMMLYLPPCPPCPAGLGVVHVTLHVALRDALDQLTPDRILATCRLTERMMCTIVGRAPRIGVCALNPHGGEEGLFGDEERTIIRPAVQRGVAEGLSLTGPLPADTLMMRAAGGEFDAVVAMLHDQGHIALKLLGMHRAVNITLGLPIVRTSAAHGTAADRAWQGTADPAGMIAAITTAADLALRSKASQAAVA